MTRQENGDIMVSVVMITYNQEKYIGKAIKRVVSQKVDFPIQLVICDDASTDHTPDIIASWSSKYPDIIDYRRNPTNIGLAANYIQAYGMCRGKYVAMCDGDDYWCSRKKLQRQVDYMERHPECALTYHRVINYYGDTREKRLSNGGGAFRQSTSAADIARRNTITNLSVMYRADLVDLHRLPGWLKEVSLVDYAMHLLYASRGYVHYMSRPMGVYRKSSGVWTHAEKIERIRMAFDVRLHMMHELSGQHDIAEAIKSSCVDHLVAMAAEGDPGQAEALLPLIDSSLTSERLKELVGKRRAARYPKKSAASRIIGAITRLLPLP